MRSGLNTALDGVIDDRWTLLADGINTQQREEGDRYTLPLVRILISECAPNGYRSALRQYPMTIVVETHDAPNADPHQADLFALANAVSVWLCTPPSLTVSGATIDSVYFDTPPERTNDGPIQSMRWVGTVHAHVSS